MKHSAYSSLSVLSLLIGTLTLVGCGGEVTFSNPGVTDTPAPPTPLSVAGPAVNGSVYGGHAPIQGAHVYLLQPGTTGYGSSSTSLLGNNGATSANGYTITADTTDPNVPTGVGAKFVTTDVNGGFSLTGAYTCVAGEPVYIYAWGGTIAATSSKNNNVVQLLTLGNCPSSGNFSTVGNGALSFVYLNEVSTVATAYTFQPFTLVTANNAWHIGSSNTTQGLLGIANAANTASQLYNIQGTTQLSSSGDGEGHLANTQTVLGTTPDRGNGIVPQATIDSLANILADCVDSTVITVGTVTAACASLFKVATNNGETGTATNEPTDTGTAAINIARFPAGNHSDGTANVDATYASDLYALQGTGTTPYVPQLSHAPNDWTLAINYPENGVTGYPLVTNNTLGLAESVAIDNIGQVWVTAQSGFYINRFTNLGVSNVLDTLTYIPGYVSVDGSDNAWTGSANSITPIYEAGSNGFFTTSYGSGYNNAYTVITDNNGNAFFFALNAATTPNYELFEYGPTGTLSGPFSVGGSADTTSVTLTITAASVAHAGGTYTYTFTATNTGVTPLAAGNTVTLALTNGVLLSGLNWPNLNGAHTVATANATQFTVTGTTNENISGTATGTGTYTFPGVSGIPSGDNVGHGAIDANQNLWITSESGKTIVAVSKTGTPIFNAIVTAQQPEFPAIDNSGNAWIPGYEAASIYLVTPTGTMTTLTSTSTGAALVYPFGSAVDGNGNVWVTNRCGPNNDCGTTANSSTLVEINGGVSTPGIANTAISPSTNYLPEAQYPATATTFTKIMLDPLNIAIDPSGNIWITNYTAVATSSSVTEIIGAAAPVVTPLSVAAGTSHLGSKP